MFRKEFQLLQQEGYLLRSCLTQGLTGLRNANLQDVGEYYVAFFQLSIGLERLMKVIVIVDHAARHDLEFPTSKILRTLGHDLHDLLAFMRGISGSWTSHPLDFLTLGSTEVAIIDQLNEFAKGTRYFNLDTLTGSTTAIDPLRRWKMILDHITTTDVPPHKRQGVTQYSARVEGVLQDRNIPSPDDIEVQAAVWQQYFERGQRYERAAGYATYRILRVLDGLRNVLYEVTSAAHAAERRLGMADAIVPHMTEFLSFVYTEDPERVAKQKHWPYDTFEE